MQTASRTLRTALLPLGLVLGAATSVAAQASAPATTAVSPCPSDTTPSSRICQAGADALTALLPIEGLLVGGGNPVPGTAGALGRFGHARLTLRVGIASLTAPKTSYDGTSDTVLADKRLLVPLPRVDLSLGLFSKALPLGSVAMEEIMPMERATSGASARSVRFRESLGSGATRAAISAAVLRSSSRFCART